jgi:hypothetical protein
MLHDVCISIQQAFGTVKIIWKCIDEVAYTFTCLQLQIIITDT